MQLSDQNPKIHSFLKKVSLWLTFFLFLKIIGFFTISEIINITRLIKIIVRFGGNGGILALYFWVKSKGFIPSFHYKNLLSPGFYFLYLALGLASLLWTSGFGFTILQLFMTFETIPFVILFMLIVSTINQYVENDILRISKIFSKSIFVVVGIFVAGMYINPDQFFRLTHGGEVARLGGFMMNPNELGMLAVVGIVSCIIEIIYNGSKIKYGFFAAILFYGLLMTSSRSSLGSFLMVVMLFVLRSNNFKIKFAVTTIIILCMPLAVQTIILKQGDLQEVMSMTGRIPFWTALLTEGLPKEPLLGFGFMRISYTDYFQSVHTYAARMTHNTFVQVLMNLGFLGFAITNAQMAFTFHAFITNKDAYLKIFFIAIFIPIFINSLTEFGIFGENNFGILFYQFLIFLFVFKYNTKLSFTEKITQKRLLKNFA